MVLIEPARQEDLSAILSLLARNGLPQDGLSDHLAAALVARDGEAVLGCAALELYGSAALLRSVCVEEALRGQGWGQRLTQAALELARQRGVARVFLLTETARDFFPRFGFRAVPRDEVDPAVQSSVEFTTACPQSAQAMLLEFP